MEAAKTRPLRQRPLRFTPAFHREEGAVLSYALVFLLVGLVAGVLNLAGGSLGEVQMSWILFLSGAVLVAIHVVTGRTVLVT